MRQFDEDTDAVQRFSQDAMRTAAKVNAAPTPRIYEVLYRYAENRDQLLNSRVDRALGAPDKGAAALEAIYDELISPQNLSEGYDEIGARLGEQMERALTLVDRGIESGEGYRRSLDDAAGSLTAKAPPSGLANIVQALVQRSVETLAEARDIGGELAAARSEIDALRREMVDLRHSAMLDHLTQIGNRRMMDQVLPREMAEATETGQPLCFALGDIDHFKAFNDTYGHDVGDGVLKVFARAFQRNVKGQDTPIRYGGEEFALILPRTSLDQAEKLLNKIRESFTETRMVVRATRERVRPVTASFGLVQFDGREDADGLIKRADQLLYQAKSDGRDRIRR